MRTIIHIGGNKTASTLLQRRLFAVHPGIRYLGEDCRDYARLRGLLDSLVGDDDSYYQDEATEEMFAACFADGVAGATCIYSNEDIMTSPLPSVCAARLKRLVPDAAIVMVIRNQLTTWPSWYANHGAYLKQVPRRYWRCHVEFDEWLEYCFSFPKKTPVEAMDYDRFYEIFARFYGPENVHVLMYEELLEAPLQYYTRWAALLGIPVDDIMNRIATHKERRRNSARRMRFDRLLSGGSWVPGLASCRPALERTIPFLKNWLDSGPAADISLPDGWAEKISEYYRDSNARLAVRANLDLERAGYPVR